MFSRDTESRFREVVLLAGSYGLGENGRKVVERRR